MKPSLGDLFVMAVSLLGAAALSLSLLFDYLSCTL